MSVLESISDKQAEILSKVNKLYLNGLTSITDAQAELLSEVEGELHLTGLTSITEKQAESLSKFNRGWEISKALQPLIDKYKKQ